ncbi:hypothetical protein [Solirubrobacter soli]|uniref:hypothetical protein n=1 Tax=Solirubrobacter soli TaxID=363832 RepID=UPI0012F9E415|nr:hypothetical protein [Solirubrobacter soli]
MRLLCVLLAFVAMACGAEERPVTETNGKGTDLLLSYEAGNHLHHYGGRVYMDGRYELRDDDDPEWTAYDPFTQEQVAEIEKAIDALDVPDHITGDRPPDAATATFVLKGRTVKVDEWPKAAPQLAELLDKIAELRKVPALPSTWRLWSKGEVVTLEARCDIGEVQALSALRDALFMPDASAARPAADDPPEGTPLVSVDFGEELLEIYADGRRVDRANGQETEKQVGADRVNAIRAALAHTDWAKLPSRLC